MSKAEERANEYFPNEDIESKKARFGFLLGYHQAEKDINDTFIHKLECWMNENFYQYAGEFAEGILAQFDKTEDAIDSFKKYMEGE